MLDNLFMDTTDSISFKKGNTVWHVLFMKVEGKLYGAAVQHGADFKSLPHLLTKIDLENTKYKLEKMSVRNIPTFEMFAQVVTGAMSLSIKYGR